MSTVAPAATASRTSESTTSRPPWSRPACGSSSNQSCGRRVTIAAMDVRRRCPADSRPTAHVAHAVVDLEAFDRRVGVGVGGADRAGPEAHVLTHGEIVVQAGGVGDEADLAAHRAAVAAAGRDRAPRPCRTRPRRGPRKDAAGWSCRRRWGPAGARSRPPRHRGRHRREQGSDRGARPRLAIGRRTPSRGYPRAV